MAVRLEPTPHDVVLCDGPARLLRYRSAHGERALRVPLLVVPSMINRHYVVDLREGVSLVGALVERGIDTWCLDWGVPRDEDRYHGWDDVLARLARMARRVRRETGARSIAVLGYCMGGTLSAIHAALHPDEVAALVNLLGPIDFSEGGLLRRMVDPRWFDAGAVAGAGNVAPHQMQAGFVALRPTVELAKWVRFAWSAHDPSARESFEALERWAGDNIPFPAAAYRVYIEELYQENRLVHGEHSALGRRVDLGAIRCPVLTVAATRDTICPLPAARALLDHVGSDDTTLHVVEGGHVGAVVGHAAPAALYPALADWLATRLGAARAVA
jgi:polyhydroxyalkanoate synthase